MPVYEFICNECNSKFVANGLYKDYASPCPNCNSMDYRLVPSVPASIRVGKYGKGGGS